MKKFQITREIGIDAGHRIADHGSKCRSLHGHRYTVQATCVGEVAGAGEENGMVMDFGFLKDEMMAEIDEPCDHAMILWWEDPVLHALIPESMLTIGVNDKSRVLSCNRPPAGKLYLVPFTPTAENLAKHWFERLSKKVLTRTSGRATLLHVRVYETPNCWAEYPG